MARILLIEDEPDTRYALGQVLAGAGHHVDEADGASGGLARLAEQPYDLLICDLQLAHGQARALLMAARQIDGLPVIAVTGGGLAGAHEQVRQATASGVAGVLHKPFETETLLAVVERVLDGEPTGAAPWRGAAGRPGDRGPTPSA